ncbi:MAG: phthalate 4,5-cis-dihydrodiol dehydrogenase [Candidatus Eremiobacteraeota bacterium]|jgi:phthalate 4,5-cis-dihydrodiol dehydrogenase|nr:phthalate 4,5-cis-dihydrodiol dehydrogenase [Candidatus Eremiobacteraeota bacterium]
MRLGVVGLGRAASSMLPSLAAHPRATLVAAADPDPAARERFARDYGGATFPGAQALCRDGAVDAVYIATPHERHVADVEIAAAYGKHAIVEKPMALTLADCDRMIQAARRAGTVLVVGHTHGFDPAVMAMRDIVRRGELGALRMIVNVVYTDFLYRPRRPEELDTALGGGILYNQIPHAVDVARTLHGGPLRSVKAVAGAWDPARRTEGALAALLEFEDGAAASIAYSGYDRFDSDELTFWIGSSGARKGPAHGSARRALAAAQSPEAEARLKAQTGYGGSGVRAARGPAHQPHFGLLLVSCERGDMRIGPDAILVYGDDGVRHVPLPEGRAFPNKDNVVDELVNAVLNGTPPLHDGAWGRATLEASLAIVQSAHERREIMLREATVAGAR